MTRLKINELTSNNSSELSNLNQAELNTVVGGVGVKDIFDLIKLVGEAAGKGYDIVNPKETPAPSTPK